MGTQEVGSGSSAFHQVLFQGMGQACCHCRMVFEHDEPVDWIYLDVNPAHERQFGFGDCAGRKASEVIPGFRSLVPEVFAAFGRAARGSTGERFEAQLPDSGERYAIHAFHSGPGEFIAQSSQVTASKQAQAQARDCQERLVRLFELCPDPISLSRASDGARLMVNRAWSEGLGIPINEAIGKTEEAQGSWVDPGERARIFEELARTGLLPPTEVMGRRRDGSRFPALITARRVAIGAEEEVLIIGKDISRQKQVADELARQEAQFRTLFECSPFGVAVSRARDGKILAVNAPWEAITGFTRDEAIGGTGWSLGLVEDPGALSAVLAKAQEGGPIGTYDMTLTRKDGAQVVVQVTGAVLVLDDEACAMTVIRDVTEDRRSRQASQEAEIRVRKADSLLRMAGSISHDFNNLFAALSANLEVLTLQLQDRPDQLKTLGTAQEVLRRATGLSLKMNEFSGRILPRLVNLDLPGFLTRWAPAWGDRQPALALQDAPAILADPASLRKVLDAVVENAWEAMDGAGVAGRVRITVKADAPGTPADDELGVWAIARPRDARTVCLEIANPGPCPPPEVLARMFEPFFTTHFIGRGLGLSSAQGLLQAMGAAIHVLPAKPDGMAFRIHFRVAEA